MARGGAASAKTGPKRANAKGKAPARLSAAAGRAAAQKRGSKGKVDAKSAQQAESGNVTIDATEMVQELRTTLTKACEESIERECAEQSQVHAFDCSQASPFSFRVDL
jgi:hypothetical protein